MPWADAHGATAGRTLAFLSRAARQLFPRIAHNLMFRPLTNMTSDFSAQFRPRYAWNDDVMRSAWWWTMWWPWLSLGMLPDFPTPQPYGVAAILGEFAGEA